jgi:leader peptidase (prepilin peptidase)/N-methyltransferase
MLGVNNFLPSSAVICFWEESLGPLVLPYLLFIASGLIAIFVTDIEKQIIPDTLSYSLFAITFAMLVVVSPEDFFLRLFVGFAVSLSFLILHLITLGRGMGLGDVKLVIFAGMFLGFKLSLVWIFSSFVIGALVGILLILASKAKFGKQIAFGPFLIVSFFMIMFFGDFLIEKLFPYL